MTSIFSLRCAECDGALQPQHGAVWSCERCHTTFEVCGQVLVTITPDHPRYARHEPVEADGNTKMRDGISVTEHRSSISSA